MWRQCENALRWTAEHDKWLDDNDHTGIMKIRENYARGQAKWMAGVRIAPFHQSQHREEPRVEEILAQAQPGHDHLGVPTMGRG